MSKVYISGPMTGIPEFNFPAFDAVAARLRDSGDEVYSPADNDRRRLAEVGIDDITSVHGFAEGNVQWYNSAIDIDTESLFRDDFNFIVNEATDIVMLPGWERSTGARWERVVAEALGLTITLCTEDGLTYVEEDPRALSDFLARFGEPTEVAEPTPVVEPLTPAELLNALRGRIGHVPGMSHRIDGIEASLA